MKRNKSFTLIEITVVITIIIFLALIFIVSYRGGEKKFALLRSANKLGQDLRIAQEMAMAGQKTAPEFGPETFPKGGYGIYFEIDSENPKEYKIVLFADCDKDNEYDESGTAQSCEIASEGNPFQEKVKEFTLEEEIYISEFFPSGDSLVITFFPPDPKITINGNPDVNLASISLTFEDSNSVRSVTINKIGLIDID